MKKRILKITTILAISAFATIGIKSANDSENPTMSLIFANVEALASDTEGVKTTWNCVGNIGKCYAMCPSCGTVVRGSGDLLGMHECQ